MRFDTQQLNLGRQFIFDSVLGRPIVKTCDAFD
jgi:hypothetical protein